MGKIKQGILGGFNGTTGSVVGASWKGIAYMRGKAQSIKNPRTPLQQGNRELFGQVSDLMSKSQTAIRRGFAGSAIKKSPFNCAVQETLKVFNNSAEDTVFPCLQFSKGSLTPLYLNTITISERVVTINFGSYVAPGDGLDYVAVYVVVGEFAGAPFVRVNAAEVTTSFTSISDSYTIPSNIEFTKVYAYVFWYDPNTKDASLTTYCGEVPTE